MAEVIVVILSWSKVVEIASTVVGVWTTKIHLMFGWVSDVQGI